MPRPRWLVARALRERRLDHLDHPLVLLDVRLLQSNSYRLLQLDLVENLVHLSVIKLISVGSLQHVDLVEESLIHSMNVLILLSLLLIVLGHVLEAHFELVCLVQLGLKSLNL